MRRIALIAGLLVLMTGGLRAQERMQSAAPSVSYRPGWTFTPTFGVAETYDDNISYFGINTADGLNNDMITTYFPEADLHYSGRHTQFDTGYTGGFQIGRAHV